MTAYVLALGLAGLLIGSFLNVVVHRVPRDMSLSSPGSACPACGHEVRWRDNIPVLSWVLLRGRCRDCAVPIAVRYPLVEAGTAAIFVAVGLRFGVSPVLPALLFVAATCFALALIDLDVQRLPFAITVPATVVTVLLLAAAGLADGWEPAGVAALSAGAWLAVYGGIWLATTGRGMGLGDVVLAPMLGLTLGWLGWGSSLVGLLGGFVVGALVGVTLMVAGRARRRTAIPFGPFMVAGAALGAFVGPALWSAYLGAALA